MDFGYIDYYINLIITITIVIFFLWVVILIILYLFYFTEIFGFIKTKQNSELNPDDRLIMAIIYILETLSVIFSFYLWNITVLLSYIYWSWLMIILFVPHLIFAGIIPIPLKIPILLFCPPYKNLYERGIIPLINTVAFKLVEMIFTGNKNKMYEIKDDISNYVYVEIKKIFEDSFNKMFKNIDYKFDDIYKKPEDNSLKSAKTSNDPTTRKDENGNEIKDTDENRKEAVKIQNSFNEDEDKKKIQTLIDQEIQICIANKSKAITSDLTSSEALAVAQENRSNYASCYAKAINLYMNDLL